MTTTLERTGTTRPPDGLARCRRLNAAEVVGGSPSWRGSRRYLRHHCSVSRVAVHPSRDGGGREPGDYELQETGGDPLGDDESAARPGALEAGSRTRRPRTIRAGAGVARWKNRECPRRLPARSAPDRGRMSHLRTLLWHGPFAAGEPVVPRGPPSSSRSDAVPTRSTRSRVGRSAASPGSGPADPSADSG